MEERRNCAYGYKTKGMYKAPAQKVGEMFAAMEAQNNLTPKAVVDASRPVGSLLHDEFEWDDTVAAEAYREVQAAAIIRCVTMIKTTSFDDGDDENEEFEGKKPEPVRAYVSTPERKHAYVRIDTALKSDVYRRHMLEEAKSDLRAFKRKYSQLTELANVVGAIDEYFNE